MEQFTTEEQQVEAIKKFWKDNGTAIILGAVLGFGGLWGWRYYNAELLASQEQASDSYQSAVAGLGKEEAAFSSVKTFVSENSDSPYAVMASLKLAKEAVDREDFSEAVKQLTWVTQSNASSAIKDVAFLRLARVQMEQENYAGALNQLNNIVASSFAAQIDEVKGDIYQRQGKIDEALEAYAAALEDAGSNPVLQMKLDDLTSQKQG